jgi:hypothetical protein
MTVSTQRDRRDGAGAVSTETVDAMMAMVWRHTLRLTVDFVIYLALAVSIVATEWRLLPLLDESATVVSRSVAIGLVILGALIWTRANSRQLRLRLLRAGLGRSDNTI